MEKALFCLLGFMILWAPLPLGSSRPWPAGFLEACMAILFFGWLLTLARKPGISRSLAKNRWVIALFWLIPAYNLLQLIPMPPDMVSLFRNTHTLPPLRDTVWSPLTVDIGASVLQLQKSLALAMLLTATIGIVNTPKKLELCMELVVLTGVIQASYGALVSLGGNAFDILKVHEAYAHNSEATGTFISRNNFAGLLEITIATGVGLVITNILQTKDLYLGWRAALRGFLQTMLGKKARLRIFLALMVAALILSRSRMGNTAFFASLGISAVVGLLVFRKHRQRSSLIFLFSSMIAIDFLILGSLFKLDQLASRLEHTTLEQEERVYVFQAALDMVKDAMPGGTGGGTFASAFDAYKTNQIFLNYIDAHNDYLQTAIEYGAAGVVIFGLITVLILWKSLFALIYRQTAALRGAAFAVIMGLISHMIHATVELNLQVLSNAFLLTLLCAFACIAYGLEHQPHHSHTARRHRHEKTDSPDIASSQLDRRPG
ncbi:O-antigen ligase-like membrane protein [Fluviicoccus keumensis]|uniref:O-antigen ligase-like membrane protein n=1 Tax=Fluviicoccus keumensis TaxID=1435465 RepID=A0A4Q7YJS4_9GAMM|nr:O-antigen ligase family protein [Fluviicoccus keumensis]RZU37114.1 O-antigen ligase-like membrane protein [Fluviicoccus keumensis]